MRNPSIHLARKIKTHNENLVIGSFKAARSVGDDDLEGSPWQLTHQAWLRL